MSITCHKCGATLPDTAKFCFECGEKIFCCPSCGNRNITPNMKFCPECGAPVGSKATATAAPAPVQEAPAAPAEAQEIVQEEEPPVREPVVKRGSDTEMFLLVLGGLIADTVIGYSDIKKLYDIIRLTNADYADEQEFSSLDAPDYEASDIEEHIINYLRRAFTYKYDLYMWMLSGIDELDLTGAYPSEEFMNAQFDAFIKEHEAAVNSVLSELGPVLSHFNTIRSLCKAKQARSESTDTQNLVLGAATGIAAVLSGGLTLPLMGAAAMFARHSSTGTANKADKERIDEQFRMMKGRVKRLKDSLLDLEVAIRNELIDAFAYQMPEALYSIIQSANKHGIVTEEKSIKLCIARFYSYLVTIHTYYKQCVSLLDSFSERYSGIIFSSEDELKNIDELGSITLDSDRQYIQRRAEKALRILLDAYNESKEYVLREPDYSFAPIDLSFVEADYFSEDTPYPEEKRPPIDYGTVIDYSTVLSYL